MRCPLPARIVQTSLHVLGIPLSFADLDLFRLFWHFTPVALALHPTHAQARCTVTILSKVRCELDRTIHMIL